MKPTSEPSTQEVLAGLVERVTFHNAENGFCVFRAKARGHRDLVTVVGHAAIISAGEWITASGEWINDRAHGQQFKARFLKTSAPDRRSSILNEVDIQAADASAAIVAAAKIALPPRTIGLLILDSKGREVFVRQKAERR